jgi:hypothetical protein
MKRIKGILCLFLLACSANQIKKNDVESPSDSNYSKCPFPVDPDTNECPGPYTHCEKVIQGEICFTRKGGNPNDLLWECQEVGDKIFCKISKNEVDQLISDKSWHCEERGEFIECKADKEKLPGGSQAKEKCSEDTEKIEVKIKPVSSPDVLLVLDSSGSMKEEISGRRKWDILVEAVEHVVSTYKDKARFGLIYFPQKFFLCGPIELNLKIDHNNTEELISLLKARSNQVMGGTPLPEALQVARQYFETAENLMEQRYILLTTDGMPTCSKTGLGDGSFETEEALAEDLLEVKTLKQMGIHTFVVGFQYNVDPHHLEDMADLGGILREDAPYNYFLAEDKAALSQSFSEILEGISNIECSFQILNTDIDPSRIEVFLNGNKVKRDPNHQDGWDIAVEENRIVFYGKTCETIQSSTITEIQIIYKC